MTTTTQVPLARVHNQDDTGAHDAGVVVTTELATKVSRPVADEARAAAAYGDEVRLLDSVHPSHLFRACHSALSTVTRRALLSK